MLLPHAQRSPEWYQARERRITASSAAAILGLDPYTGPLGAFNAIMGRHKQDDNKHMAWGRQYESQARESYEVLSGNLVVETGFWVHPSLNWLGASPDGLVGEDGLVEIKCPGTLPTEIPGHHEIQMMVQMAVTGRNWCDYYAWSQTGEFCRRQTRNLDEEAYLLKRLQEFYDAYIKPDVAPPRRRPPAA